MRQTKNNKKNVTNNQTDEKREHYAGLLGSGEVLGNELISLLALHGCSFEGLVIETYAMCKALAALEVIAETEGFDMKDLMEKLKPSFKEEVADILKEVGPMMN